MAARARASLLLVVALAAALGTCGTLARTAADAWTAVTSSPAPSPDDGVSLLAATAGAGLSGWLALGVLACVGSAAAQASRGGAVRTGRVLAALTPRLVRQAAATAVGLSVVAVPVAQAAGTGPPGAPTPTSPAASPAAVRLVDVVDPGWGQPVVPAAAPATARPSADTARREVVVRPGDCLWRLAASTLPDAATDRQIARTWPRWYAANRAVIGADPDRLVPGQRLVAPPPGAAPTPNDPDTPGSPS